MKKNYKLHLSVILILTFITFSGTLVLAQNCDPYLGQTPPGLTPEIFAPGIISTTNTNEWSCTFSPDSTEMFFYRIGENYYCTLYSCKFENGSWTDPAEVDFSAAYSASEPFITPDNQRLYFSWDIGSTQFPDIYKVERTNKGWSTPVIAGQGMWLTSDAQGQLYTTDLSSLLTTGKTYLAKVTTNNGIFIDYERLTISPYYGYQAHPCIAPDSSFIIFDVNGGSHLFVSFKKPDGNWSTAINLVNHGFDINAGGPNMSPDGKYLFFHLEGDIWWVDANVIRNLNPYVGIEERGELMPNSIQLFQNEPNSYSSQTKIAFELDHPNNVSLEIIDIIGNIVQVTIKNKTFQKGRHEILVDASDLPSGIYSYVLTTSSGHRSAKKMLVVK